MLPRIKISYLNGLLGTVSDSADGLFAIVGGATAVSTTFALETPYTITSLDDLEALGVTSTNNASLYKDVKEFYDEAEDGTKVVIMGVDKTATKETLCSKESTGVIRKLLIALDGKLKGIFLAHTAAGESDTKDAAAAQALAEWATDTLYAPLFFVLDFTGQEEDEATDFSSGTNNRVAYMIGDTAESSGTSAIGLLAGRLASIGVQRNCGRVKDGALSPTSLYLFDELIEKSNLISTLYDKGYIVPRKYVGRSGYFFADDNMACDPTDDYAHIALRRTIDKAYRIAYDTLLDYMLDELEINSDGTLQVGVIKSWQQAVENAINRQMTANGELSSSNDEEGCQCYIDETQNVLSTSKVEVTIKVRPYGYARYIDVNLGFLVTNE